MKILIQINKIWISLSILFVCIYPIDAATQSNEKPNIVLVLMDNFGYGEIGVYGGGELRGAPTPNIDSIAAEGFQLTNYNVEAKKDDGTCTFNIADEEALAASDFVAYFTTAGNKVSDAGVTSTNLIPSGADATSGTVSLVPSESSILLGDYSSSYSNPNKDTTLLPLAVRYADVKRGLYVVERPPFKISPDFSKTKGVVILFEGQLLFYLKIITSSPIFISFKLKNPFGTSKAYFTSELLLFNIFKDLALRFSI